ncbi:MAG: hypothetical protein M0C28_27590 [Candidatus Moduliflexus flocculans]|nr:hypothetical protein [Candidatus Moduliflexus flocculans]
MNLSGARVPDRHAGTPGRGSEYVWRYDPSRRSSKWPLLGGREIEDVGPATVATVGAGIRDKSGRSAFDDPGHDHVRAGRPESSSNASAQEVLLLRRTSKSGDRGGMRLLTRNRTMRKTGLLDDRVAAGRT